MSFRPDDVSGGEFGTEAAVNLTLADDEQLEASIVALSARIHAAQAELALRAIEYERRRIAEERHALSTKQWLVHACRMDPREATQVLRLGGSLGGMPALMAASLSGRVPAASQRAVASLRERYREAFADHGEVVVEAATYLSPRDLRRVIRVWEEQVHPGVVGIDARAAAARRRLSLNATFDGMWALSGELDPESGHVVSTAIGAMADPGNIDPSDARTPAQRRADAVVEACRFWLDHNATAPTSGGIKPHITVTVDYDALVARAADAAGIRLDRGSTEIDGMPVTGEAIRRLACDADIVRVVTAGAGEVLDVGRSTRVVPTGMRRALDLRDRGCTWDGCDAPASWCDAHHIEHWADGGPTSLANLRLLCRRHHGVVHDEADRERRRPRSPVRPPDP